MDECFQFALVSSRAFGRILGFLDFSQHHLSKSTIVALELCAEIVILSSSEFNLQSDKMIKIQTFIVKT